MLTPNYTYTANGVKVNEKIIPDGSRWTDATKAKKAGFSANALYKAQKKLCGTGKPQSVTIHNTGDLPGTYDDGEQYTRATWPNQNMNSSRVHFFVDDTCAWQDLKAGTGMTPNDPVGSAEVSWHSGDGSVSTGGNMTSLSIEIIMGDTAENDAKARDNGARLAAWLLWKNGLPIDKLFTHTYWVNKLAGKTFADPDTQCTNPIKGKKWCPTYIFASSNAATAKKNWQAFKAQVKTYLDALGGTAPAEPSTPSTGGTTPAPSTTEKAVNYTVKVTVKDLHIRSGPGTGYANKGFIAPGVYTITAEATGTGATLWGKLKSGAGWIALDYATRTGTTAPAVKAVTEGSTVTIKPGAVYGGLASSRGAQVPSYITGARRYTVKQIATHKGDQEALLAEINSWVALSYLVVV